MRGDYRPDLGELPDNEMGAPAHYISHRCEKCREEFPIERHRANMFQSHWWIEQGTGRNMVYKGDINREYAMCPACGEVESQVSAEARDCGEQR